jgi:hypothetical protein
MPDKTRRLGPVEMLKLRSATLLITHSPAIPSTKLVTVLMTGRK